MENFILKDFLGHKAYSFPKTVLRYEQTGEMPKYETDVLLQNGVAIPYQAECMGDNKYALKIISDLPTSGQHVFEWAQGTKRVSSPLDKGLDNGILRIDSLPNGLVSLVHKNGMTCKFSIQTKKKILSVVEEISGGSIEKTIVKELSFTDGSKYIFSATIKKDLDYVEILEDMRGWAQDGSALSLTWTGFTPRYRYTHKRQEEKIDEYLQSDGSFPFLLNPHMDGGRRRDQKGVAYEDKNKGFWLGILFHDILRCDSGKYEIGKSGEESTFTLYEDRCVAPVAGKTRAFMCILCDDKPTESLVSLYIKYYSHVCLDKFKDWVLEWDDDKTEYPKYYSVKSGAPTAEDMMNLVENTKVFATFEWINSVHNRTFIYDWAPTFDMTANQMTEEQFQRVRAAVAFVCYVLSQENAFPIETLLAGHPNFLADTLGTVGIFTAILGKRHPAYRKWLAYYEKATARNLKYHIRPAIEKWGALGGRWTENVGCYMLGALHCTVEVCSVIYHTTGGEMPLLYSHFKPLLAFLVDMQTAENEHGRRLYMPQGAHSATGEFGGSYGSGYFPTMIQLADMCRYFAPTLSEYILYNYRKQEDFDGVFFDKPQWKHESYRAHTQNLGGTPPDLRSCKYTGLGFMLRNAVNTDGEMMVFLQQIDEGPNYRWGRAAQGGCGELYYYANRKKYTDHSPEDVGDENKGDVQACTNFGVLVGHEFKSVGRNDLTEPLMDFGFAQYARVNAGEYSSPYYKYRSLMMIGNEYIAVYDAVADFMQYGRFSWAQNQADEFPTIWNVKPGVDGVDGTGGFPVDKTAMFNLNHPQCKTKLFDGLGDFLTVVTHLKDGAVSAPTRTDYGFALSVRERTDRVFNSQSKTYFQGEDYAFTGYVGYQTQMPTEVRMAIFDGEYIAQDGVSLRIPYEKGVRRAMSLRVENGRIFGQSVFERAGYVRVETEERENAKVWIDGNAAAFSYADGAYVFEVPMGNCRWNVGEYSEIPKGKLLYTRVGQNQVQATWEELTGAQSYELQLQRYGDDCVYAHTHTKERVCVFNNLPNGKYFLQVRGVRGERKGTFSHPYPVYIDGKKPHCPEGLRVTEKDETFVAVWGEVLGVDEYRLYRKTENGNTLVYQGAQREICVERGAYFVTSVNGVGESEPSLVRSTDDERAKWDNHPELGFVRDTRSAEDGYPGFSYVENAKSGVLKYEK